MGWLFKIEKEEDYEELAKRLELDMQIRDIRRRIEKLRTHFHTPRRGRMAEPQKVDEPTPVVEQKQTEQERRNAEMDDLRRKLMGGKK